MNKRFLLPVLAIVCCAASNNGKTETDFDLSIDRAESLTSRAARAILDHCRARAEAGNGPISEDNKSELSTIKDNAESAKQELIEFGNQAQAAEKTGAAGCLAGITSPADLLCVLQLDLFEQARHEISAAKKSIERLQSKIVEDGEGAIYGHAQADKAQRQGGYFAELRATARSLEKQANDANNQINGLDQKIAIHEKVLETFEQEFGDYETVRTRAEKIMDNYQEILKTAQKKQEDEQLKQRAAVEERRANHFNDNNVETEPTKQLDSTIKNLDDMQPSSAATFAQYARTIATDKWTKRTACALVAGSIGKWLYNRYSPSKKSNDKENGHE